MQDCIEFAKLSGSGNDFICIDNRDGRYDHLLADEGRLAHFARSLCSRGQGIGADGLMLAVQPEVPEVADAAAIFLEADGSQAELCGNGTACFIHWVRQNNWVPPGQTRILTPAGVVRGENSTGQYVRVCIPLPEDAQADVELTVRGQQYSVDYVITGVPHAVLYVDDIAEAEVYRLGPAIRHHPRFAPRGVNVNFVQVVGEGQLAVRTWEFGVEGETLACGTGSAAAAILTSRRLPWPHKYRRGEPIEVHVRSGDVLRVILSEDDDGNINDVCLETIVRYLYVGQVHPELLAVAMQTPASDAPAGP